MAIAVLHESTFVEACLNGAVVGEALHGDRRAAVRLSAEDASWRRAARLKYGPEVRVIDVSTGGILVEVEGAPLTPQSNIVFELSGEIVETDRVDWVRGVVVGSSAADEDPPGEIISGCPLTTTLDRIVSPGPRIDR